MNKLKTLTIIALAAILTNVSYAVRESTYGPITSDKNPLPVSSTFGVPNTFTEQTSSARTYFVQEGQLNHYRQRPAVLNEHVETARQVQTVVNAGNPIAGQIFKASQDNINGINLTLEQEQTFVVDDFEGYADDAALQAAWVESNATYKATLSTTIVFEGSQSMTFSAAGTVNDTWETTIASQDLTGYTGSLAIYQTRSYNLQKLRFYIGDGTNTKSAPVVVQQEGGWEIVEISEPQLAEDGGGTTNTAAITKVGFRLEDRDGVGVFYIDDLKAAPTEGNVQLELWDMGASIPVTAVTSLDDGTQYTELGDRGLNSGSVAASINLALTGGKRQYFVFNYVAGTALEIPSNTLLTPNNYYAIVIRYTDTNINVYGTDTSFVTNYYANGYAFTAPNNSTAITQVGTYNDVQFAVFSTQDVYLNTLLKFYDAEPGNAATETVYIEDSNMQITGVVANNNTPEQRLFAEFKDRSFFFPKGGKFEVNHSDDFTDNISQVTVLIGYMYKPPTTND